MGIIDYSELSERDLEALQSRVGKGSEALKVFIADILPQPSLSSLPEGERKLQMLEYTNTRMIELENLVTTFGGVVILEHIQKRGIPDYKTYIGSGKLDEIIHEMHIQGANLLVLGNILKPHQIYNINEKLKKIGAVCWDRVDLILKIFEKNAKTEETKLQIELAAIKHMGPRIFNMGMELGKQAGKGSGETNTEIMKRHLGNREKEIRKKLEGYSKVRENHRQGRKKKGFLTVGIVGYTNAGKSTLLNKLTNKGVLSEDKLFATLGTSVGKMWLSPLTTPLSKREGTKNIESKNEAAFLPMGENCMRAYVPGKEILFSDTIGFIRDLPPELVDAFASTLEDSIESDILFHVVDMSDPKIDEKIKVVDDILTKIGTTQEKIYVFNKSDILTEKERQDVLARFQDRNPVCISTYSGCGLEDLKDVLRTYI